MTVETTLFFPTNMTSAKSAGVVPVSVKPKLRIQQSDVTSAGAVALNWLKALTETGTDNPIQYVQVLDGDFASLEQAALKADEIAFTQTARKVNWLARPVQDYVRAVRLALQTGAHGFARHLSQEGGKRFPEHAEMQQLANLLAPARIIKTHLPADPRAGLDMRWLKEHGDEYRGQWVALDHGELLGAAPTYKELAQKIGSPIGKNILVTPVY